MAGGLGVFSVVLNRSVAGVSLCVPSRFTQSLYLLEALSHHYALAHTGIRCDSGVNCLHVQAVGLDASSAASRTDVIIIALSATLLLTGLQWIALRPVEKEAVRSSRFLIFALPISNPLVRSQLQSH